MGARKKQVGGCGDWLLPFVLFGFIALGCIVAIWYMKRSAGVGDAVAVGSDDEDGKVCMSKSEYDKLKKGGEKTDAITEDRIVIALQAGGEGLEGGLGRGGKVSDVSAKRDYRVLQDPLFPPLNRTDTVTHDMLERKVNTRNMYVPVNEVGDNYRLVGYLVNKSGGAGGSDAGGNNWKLMARQKDRNTSDFYMIPANNNYDIKIHITDDMVVGDRLRDVYTIPKTLKFNSPMLGSESYEFVEIPKADLSSSTRYF